MIQGMPNIVKTNQNSFDRELGESNRMKYISGKYEVLHLENKKQCSYGASCLKN